MDDDLGFGADHQLGEAARLGDVEDRRFETEPLLQIVEPRPLQSDIVILRQVVEPEDRRAVAEKTGCEVVADEAGDPGHQNLHSGRPAAGATRPRPRLW